MHKVLRFELGGLYVHRWAHHNASVGSIIPPKLPLKVVSSWFRATSFTGRLWNLHTSGLASGVFLFFGHEGFIIKGLEADSPVAWRSGCLDIGVSMCRFWRRRHARFCRSALINGYCKLDWCSCALWRLCRGILFRKVVSCSGRDCCSWLINLLNG